MLRGNPIDVTHPEAHKINKQLLGVHTLASTFDVLRMDKQAASVRRLVKKQQDGTLGQPDEDGMAETDDTNVTIGDTYTFHGAAEQAAAGPITPTTPTTPSLPQPTEQPVTQPPPGLSAKKAALWAALALAAGGGLGAGTLALYTALSADDTNTLYSLEFGETDTAPRP